MKRMLFACLVSGLIALPAQAALREGERAPEFTAQASLAGKAFAYSLKEALKKGPVVVYFFPAAFTSGCNIQAHAFAVNQAKFLAAGASVIGVSLDDIGRLNAFSADPDYCSGKVAVASDADGHITRAYDLGVKTLPWSVKDTRGADIAHGFAERTTFVITPDGHIKATIGGLAPAANVEAALKAVESLAAGKPKP